MSMRQRSTRISPGCVTTSPGRWNEVALVNLQRCLRGAGHPRTPGAGGFLESIFSSLGAAQKSHRGIRQRTSARGGNPNFDRTVRSLVATTGYTGEVGFEVLIPANEATRFWDSFIASGAKPCGLGARDTLRLEMCYPLNGSDLSADHTPLEAGLGAFVDFDKGPLHRSRRSLAAKGERHR